VSQRPGAVAIGGFLLGAIVLVIGAVVFFGGALLGDAADVRRAVVIFTGSVKGLNVGAPVTLRGVKIGEVKDIGVSYDGTKGAISIPVTVEVHVAELGLQRMVDGNEQFEELVVRGLRAQLKTESLLTGLLYIDLGFLPDTKPRWVRYGGPLPQIPTAPTEIEEILARVSSIDITAFVQRADNTLRALEALLSDPQTRAIPGEVNATLAEVRGLAADADLQVKTLGTRLDAVAWNANGTMDSVRTDVHAVSADLQKSLAALDTALASVRGTSDELGYALSDRSPALAGINQAAAELGRAARALQELADALAREPESLLRGRERTDEEPHE
jgi:paraquat-inducible protein B